MRPGSNPGPHLRLGWVWASAENIHESSAPNSPSVVAVNTHSNAKGCVFQPEELVLASKANSAVVGDRNWWFCDSPIMG